MAYKFQRGEANLSGSIELSSAEAELSVSQQDGSKTVELTQAGVVSGSSQGHFNKLTIDSVDVISNAQQLQNIASLDATTENTIEAAIDTLANLGSMGSNGAELEALGSLDVAQGLKIANANFVDASRNVLAAAVNGTTISGSGDGRFLALDIDGVERIDQAGIMKPSAISASFGSTLTMADGAFAVSNAGAMQAQNISGSGTLNMGGTVRLDGVAQAAVDVAGDFIVFVDDSDQLLKKEAVGDFAADLAGTGLEQNANTIRIAASAAGDGLSGGGGSALAVSVDDSSIEINSDSLRVKAAGVTDAMLNDDVATGLAGVGLAASSGVLALDFNELTEAAVSEANDSLVFIDSDGNASRKDTIVDFVAAIAGSGLSAASGKLSTQAGTVRLVDDSTTLVEGYNYYTGSANKSVTLPASPSVGDVVYVKAQDLGDGNAITISRAGSHTIDGETSILLESDFAAVGFVYLVANNWAII